MGYLGQARDWLYADAPPARRSRRTGASSTRRAAARLGAEEGGERRAADAAGVGAGLPGADGARPRGARRGQEARPRVPRQLGAPMGAAEAVGSRPQPRRRSSVVGEEADRATWDAMRGALRVGRRDGARAPAVGPEQRRITGARGARRSSSIRASRQRDDDAAGRPAVPVETRDSAWAWLKEHYDAILGALPRHHGGAALLTGRSFCDEAHADDVEEFLKPRAATIEGGARVLASPWSRSSSARPTKAPRAAGEGLLRDPAVSVKPARAVDAGGAFVYGSARETLAHPGRPSSRSSRRSPVCVRRRTPAPARRVTPAAVPPPARAAPAPPPPAPESKPPAPGSRDLLRPSTIPAPRHVEIEVAIPTSVDLKVAGSLQAWRIRRSPVDRSRTCSRTTTRATSRSTPRPRPPASSSRSGARRRGLCASPTTCSPTPTPRTTRWGSSSWTTASAAPARGSSRSPGRRRRRRCPRSLRIDGEALRAPNAASSFGFGATRR